MTDLISLARPSVLKLKAYSSARDEFSGAAEIYLDANENPYNNGMNRYPDPLALEIKKNLSEQKNIPIEQIFVGSGSDEVIDVVMRVFCEPRIDNILILPPTYGMYEVSANIHDVGIKQVPLTPDFQPKTKEILETGDAHTKILFLCHPNNPTGNLFALEDIRMLLKNFQGIVVVDEAYIDFAPTASCISFLKEFQNLIVMQTLSKAWGLAGIRLGMAYASSEIISLMNKVKAPYNVNILTQHAALKALKNKTSKEKKVLEILKEREKLMAQLKKSPLITKVYPTDANFILAECLEADKLYHYLLSQGIVVRNRSSNPLTKNCLRFTVGTPKENKKLMESIKNYAVNVVEV